MRPVIAAAAIFASSTLAATYAAGDICYSNIECEKNCLNKQYTIADQTVDSSLSATRASRIRAATKASCTALGGRDCGAYVTSSKRSLDEEVRKDWAKRCTANGKGAEMRIPEIKLMADEKAATNYCK
ncbi:hypothetical protein Q7P36_002132 [Cladosporium allicinum]